MSRALMSRVLPQGNQKVSGESGDNSNDCDKAL